jgi:hypothetical protein
LSLSRLGFAEKRNQTQAVTGTADGTSVKESVSAGEGEIGWNSSNAGWTIASLFTKLTVLSEHKKDPPLSRVYGTFGPETKRSRVADQLIFEDEQVRISDQMKRDLDRFFCPLGKSTTLPGQDLS